MTGAHGVSRECRDWGGDGGQEWPGALPAFFLSLGLWLPGLRVGGGPVDCHGSGSPIIGRKGSERELRSGGRPSRPASATLPLSRVDRPVSQQPAGAVPLAARMWPSALLEAAPCFLEREQFSCSNIVSAL